MITTYLWWDLSNNLKDDKGEILYILLLTLFSPLLLLFDFIILPFEIISIIIYKILRRKNVGSNNK